MVTNASLVIGMLTADIEVSSMINEVFGILVTFPEATTKIISSATRRVTARRTLQVRVKNKVVSVRQTVELLRPNAQLAGTMNEVTFPLIFTPRAPVTRCGKAVLESVAEKVTVTLLTIMRTAP